MGGPGISRVGPRVVTRALPPPGSTPALLPQQGSRRPALFEPPGGPPGGRVEGSEASKAKQSKQAKGVRMFSNLARSHGPVMGGDSPHVGVEGAI